MGIWHSSPYPLCPQTVPLQCDVGGVEAIPSKLSGTAGIGSVDAAMAKAMLTAYGCRSAELREELVAWAEWLANTSPLWVAAEKTLANLLAARWEQPYSNVVNFVRVRMQLAVIRATTLLLRTERDKQLWTRRAPEESAACLGGRRLTD